MPTLPKFFSVTQNDRLMASSANNTPAQFESLNLLDANLTGIPIAPFTPSDTSSNQVATTGFVQNVSANMGSSLLQGNNTWTGPNTFTNTTNISKNSNSLQVNSSGVYVDVSSNSKIKLTNGSNSIFIESDKLSIQTSNLYTSFGSGILHCDSSGKISSALVDTDDVASSSITNAKIYDGSITDDKIAMNALTLNKINSVDKSTSATINTLAVRDSSGYLYSATAPVGEDSTLVATTEFVKTSIENLINSAPNVLDTLNEISVALNNDPSFNSTMLNLLAGKVDNTTYNTAISTLTNDISSTNWLKADKTYVNDEIATLTNDISSTNWLKADKTYVNDEIATLTNDISSTNWLKADKTYVIDEISTLTNDISSTNWLKADKTYVIDEISTLTNDISSTNWLKADKTYVVDEITNLTNDISSTNWLKADKSYVNDEISTLTNDISSTNWLKADVTYVNTEIANLINSAPAVLDTLNEISNALNNDPSFNTTMLNLLAGKVDNSTYNTAITTLTNDISSTNWLKADKTAITTLTNDISSTNWLKADKTAITTLTNDISSTNWLKADKTAITTLTNDISSINYSKPTVSTSLHTAVALNVATNTTNQPFNSTPTELSSSQFESTNVGLYTSKNGKYMLKALVVPNESTKIYRSSNGGTTWVEITTYKSLNGSNTFSLGASGHISNLHTAGLVAPYNSTPTNGNTLYYPKFIGAISKTGKHQIFATGPMGSDDADRKPFFISDDFGVTFKKISTTGNNTGFVSGWWTCASISDAAEYSIGGVPVIALAGTNMPIYVYSGAGWTSTTSNLNIGSISVAANSTHSNGGYQIYASTSIGPANNSVLRNLGSSTGGTYGGGWNATPGSPNERARKLVSSNDGTKIFAIRVNPVGIVLNLPMLGTVVVESDNLGENVPFLYSLNQGDTWSEHYSSAWNRWIDIAVSSTNTIVLAASSATSTTAITGNNMAYINNFGQNSVASNWVGVHVSNATVGANRGNMFNIAMADAANEVYIATESYDSTVPRKMLQFEIGKYVVSEEPTNPKNGQTYYDIETKTLKVYYDGTWY